MTDAQPTKDTLLADMRRKYLHGLEKDGSDPKWLLGEPITSRILERWIPQVEALIQERDHFKEIAEMNRTTIIQMQRAGCPHCQKVLTLRRDEKGPNAADLANNGAHVDLCSGSPPGEAYRLINAALHYVPLDRELHAEMVAYLSPTKGVTHD